jgi:hypothetical protein
MWAMAFKASPVTGVFRVIRVCTAILLFDLSQYTPDAIEGIFGDDAAGSDGQRTTSSGPEPDEAAEATERSARTESSVAATLPPSE